MIIDTTCSVVERKMKDAKPFFIEADLEGLKMFKISDFCVHGDFEVRWTTGTSSDSSVTYTCSWRNTHEEEMLNSVFLTK